MYHLVIAEQHYVIPTGLKLLGLIQNAASVLCTVGSR